MNWSLTRTSLNGVVVRLCAYIAYDYMLVDGEVWVRTAQDGRDLVDWLNEVIRLGPKLRRMRLK